MVNSIKVSVPELSQDRNSIQEEILSIRQEIDELYEEMQRLGQTWEGPAWQTFQNQVASDVENMMAIYDQLASYLNHIDFALTEYQRCENRVGSIVDSIRV